MSANALCAADKSNSQKREVTHKETQRTSPCLAQWKRLEHSESSGQGPAAAAKPTSAAQSSIHLNAAAAEAAMAPRLRGPPGIRREDTAPPIAEAGDVWGDPALLLPRDLTGGCAARGGDLPATLRAAKRPDRRGVRPEEGTPPPPSRPPTPGAARLALLAYQLQEASAHLSQ